MGVEMREFLPGERICGQCGELGREQCCGETCDESAACPICGETYWKGSDKCLTEAAERIILANAERDAARKRVEELEEVIARPIKPWVLEETWPALMVVMRQLLATDEGRLILKAWGHLEDTAAGRLGVDFSGDFDHEHVRRVAKAAARVASEPEGRSKESR